jgi:hypothetical protein
MDDPLLRWVNQNVILDTGAPVVYTGFEVLFGYLLLKGLTAK